jgi:hypothetical protein
MNSRTLSYLVIGVFVLLGAVLIATRYHSRRAAQSARESSLWRLSYDIDFETTTSADELRIALPFDTPHCRVVDDPKNYPGLRSEEHGPYIGNRTRELWLSALKPDVYNFKAAFDLQLSPQPDMSRQLPLENLSGGVRERYLRNEPDEVPTQSKEIRDVAVPDEGTNAERVQWIFNRCVGIPSGDSDDPRYALEGGSGTPLAKARAMTALCRSIRIPARMVTGFEIKQGADVKPHVWVEVYQGQSWIPFDPEHGYTFAMPMQFVPVRRGGSDVIDKRRSSVKVNREVYSIQYIKPPQSVLQTEVKHPKQILNLQRLPVPMHKIMKILLLLPFAALITSLVRNVIGISTFGTFSPALLAMSFIYADWETGLAILTVVMIAGLVSRTFLDRLRLLMVPRLSVMLTIVILCIVLGVSLLDYMEVTPGPDAVLLPMVILTMLIERFFVTTEEDGLVFTLQLAAGTLLVAALCYLVLAWERVGEFILIYPEFHFLTIAVFILIGRYAGYRLTELWRFRDLVGPTETRP